MDRAKRRNKGGNTKERIIYKKIEMLRERKCSGTKKVKRKKELRRLLRKAKKNKNLSGKYRSERKILKFLQ